MSAPEELGGLAGGLGSPRTRSFVLDLLNMYESCRSNKANKSGNTNKQTGWSLPDRALSTHNKRGLSAPNTSRWRALPTLRLTWHSYHSLDTKQCTFYLAILPNSQSSGNIEWV